VPAPSVHRSRGDTCGYRFHVSHHADFGQMDEVTREDVKAYRARKERLKKELWNIMRMGLGCDVEE
jgi:hypothetical protein